MWGKRPRQSDGHVGWQWLGMGFLSMGLSGKDMQGPRSSEVRIVEGTRSTCLRMFGRYSLKQPTVGSTSGEVPDSDGKDVLAMTSGWPPP